MMRQKSKIQLPSLKNGRGIWLGAIVGLIMWTLVVGLVYFVAEALIAGISNSVPALAETGKSLVAPEVNTIFKLFDTNQLVSSGVALFGSLLAPVIWIIWGIGAAIILLLPSILVRAVKKGESTSS